MENDSKQKHEEENKTTIESADSVKKVDVFYQNVKQSFNPIMHFAKKKVVRYALSTLLLATIIYFYVLFESRGTSNQVHVFFFDMSPDFLVPIGLILALLALLYVSWDDELFKKYRGAGFFLIILTAIFYTFIYTGIDEYLFELSIAKWLTRLTGIIVTSILKIFGMNITGTTWDSDRGITIVSFNGPSDASIIGIDAACSGIHSLTIFIVVFIVMILEARKRLVWNYKIAVITLLGILGTYFVNLIRISIILTIDYFKGWDVAGPVHNYLGYVFLMIWIPLFWFFVLSWGQKGKPKKDLIEPIVTDTDSEKPTDAEVEEDTTTKIVRDMDVN